MSFTSENNILFSSLGEGIATSEYKQSHISFIGRILIDTFIVLGSIAATVLSGGAASPLLGSSAGVVFGTAGSVIAGATNTTIDIAEGNTDALTLGLDIGLPIATEGLGVAITAGLKAFVPLGGFKQFENINQIFKNSGTKATFNNISKYNKNLDKVFNAAAKNAKPATINAFKGFNKSIEKSLATIRLSITSLTDMLDKVTGVVKRYLLSLIPKLEKYLLKLKKYLKKLNKFIRDAFHPFAFGMRVLKKKGMYLIKNEKIMKEAIEKVSLRNTWARTEVKKRSILSNAVITQYNLVPVNSSWILGTSTIITEVDDNGRMVKGDLIWFFVPEKTAHNGKRGAIPEPLGKRPIIMRNLTKEKIEQEIQKTSSFGAYYLNNVAGGRADTMLYGSKSAAGDLKQNKDMRSFFTLGKMELNKIFSNALSLVPGYSLYSEIKMSVTEAIKLSNDIISGTYGKNIVKNIVDWKSHLNKYGRGLIPKGEKQISDLIYKSQMLKNDVSKKYLKNSSEFHGSKNGVKITKIKHIKKM